MGFSFSSALSGLDAASQSISVSGNNIANANTTGFKSVDITFSDVFANASGIRLNGAGAALQTGQGVRVAATPTNFRQGSVSTTDIATNAAIEGNGFFVVADSNNTKFYTRAGDFQLDKTGKIVTPAGQEVQGYAATNGIIPPGAPISSLRVPIGETYAPVATSEATFRMNLNVNDAVGSEFHAPVQVFDSKGATHSLDMVFTKQADGSYLLNAMLDGNPAQLNANGAGATAAPVPVTFDSTGTLLNLTSLSVLPDQTQLSGAILPQVTINLQQPAPPAGSGLYNITNYASPSGVASTDQNGLSAGELTGLAQAPDQNGGLYAVFNNGQRRLLGQFALATFNAQGAMRRLGGNLYGETLASGPPSIGTPGSSGRGTVVGSATEESNVDIATEFTNLIVAQRGFQANSKVISTISQTLQELFQIG